ncbi:MAG: PDZ domain-containing protein [Bacteroidetes bacterium]|nr:PDZ domain-containing protein [Bacteroidota bacterium]
MKSIKAGILMLNFAFVAPIVTMAQKEQSDTTAKKKDVQQIIITNKGVSDKVVVEIDGDKITVNGKPIDELKDKINDLTVRVNKFKQLENLSMLKGMPYKKGDVNEVLGFFDNNNFNLSMFETRAMLGVATEKTEGGVQVKSVTKESAAERAGLKENDIITKVNDTKIATPDELSAAIKNFKPGEKVIVTYLRGKKEQKATAELTKWEGNKMEMTTQGIDINDMFRNLPRIREGYNMGRMQFGTTPKLGISVQDAEDGKGVKVLDVDEESNAQKAGILKNDIITRVDDTAVSNVDEVSKAIKEKKDQATVKLQVVRSGKTQTVEVKVPRKLKTAEL